MDDQQQPPKRRGRPPGPTLPEERRKGPSIHFRVTAAQADAYRAMPLAERRAIAESVRRRLDRGSR